MAFSTMTNRATGYIVLESDWDDITDNFDVLNTDAVYLFPDLGPGQVPASGIVGAAFEIAESSDSGTAKPLIEQLLFDDTTDEGRIWSFRMPRQYGGNPVLVGSYKMAGANVSKTVGLVAQLAAVSDGDAAHSAKAYAAANASTEAVPDDADTSDEFSITLTNDDSVTANDWVSLILYRDVDASDDASGDFQLTSLSLNFTLEA